MNTVVARTWNTVQLCQSMFFHKFSFDRKWQHDHHCSYSPPYLSTSSANWLRVVLGAYHSEVRCTFPHLMLSSSDAEMFKLSDRTVSDNSSNWLHILFCDFLTPVPSNCAQSVLCHIDNTFHRTERVPGWEKGGPSTISCNEWIWEFLLVVAQIICFHGGSNPWAWRLGCQRCITRQGEIVSTSVQKTFYSDPSSPFLELQFTG